MFFSFVFCISHSMASSKVASLPVLEVMSPFILVSSVCVASFTLMIFNVLFLGVA